MLILVISGMMRYFSAFSLSATSFHVLSALGVLLLTLIHLSHHFKSLLRHVKKICRSPLMLGVSIGVIVLILVSAGRYIGPAAWLMSYSYESRHKQDIFRAHPKVVFETIESKTKVHRAADGVNLLIECELNEVKDVVFAIWAESNGDMIEPLYVSPALAYSKTIAFKQDIVQRKDLLPVFFDAYHRMKQRLSEDGEDVDGVSAATISGSFSLDSLFESRLKQFTVMLEINKIGDENDHFKTQASAQISQMPFGVGVPSLLYQSDVDLYEDVKYYLMERLGRSDARNETVSILYDTEGMGSALELVEKNLIRVQKTD